MANKAAEDLSLEFNNNDQLSYNDTKQEFVELFLDDKSVGNVMVWTDRDNEARVGTEQEYILINYTMVYLDSIKKR